MKKQLNFNSLEAYRRLPEFMSKHHKLIYEAMNEHKYRGFSRFELSKYISLNHEQIGRRFNEMRKAGLIKLSANTDKEGKNISTYRIRLYGEEADVFKPALSKAEKELMKLAELHEEALKTLQERQVAILNLVDQTHKLEKQLFAKGEELKSEQLEHAVLKEKYKRVEAAHEEAIQIIERYEQLTHTV